MKIKDIIFSCLFIYSLWLCHIISFIQGFNTCTDITYDEVHYRLGAAMRDGVRLQDKFGNDIQPDFITYKYLDYDIVQPTYDTIESFKRSLRNMARV